MDINKFLDEFKTLFTTKSLVQPALLYRLPWIRSLFDSCPDVQGMTSVKKQKLLNVAFRNIPSEECYLEIGTFQGKSLVSAMLDNPPKKVFACDNFSEFTESNSYKRLMNNLSKYGFKEQVVFYNDDFKKTLNKKNINIPVGLYFFDGPHDKDNQYQGIKLGEPLLADQALVLVDDWRLAEDSGSFAKEGTMQAIQESSHSWELLYDLPARYNGDRGLWWNGLAVFSFQRKKG
jgi:predicted O-methyltransferase YrrM